MTKKSRGFKRGQLAVLAVGTMFSYLVYPLSIGLAKYAAPSRPLKTRSAEPSSFASPEDSPAIAVVIPAYLEAGVIGAKVESLVSGCGLRPDQVVVACDGDPDTAKAAEAAGATVLYQAARKGKAAAMNSAILAVAADFVIFTDADCRFDRRSVERAVSHLASDCDVAVVSGTKQECGSAGEGAYWRFEEFQKNAERRLGIDVAVLGEFLAVRTRLWTPIDESTANDDLWIALEALRRGYKVIVDPQIVAVETVSRTAREQFERRVRIMSGQLPLFWRYRGVWLSPTGTAYALFGHKVWRSTGGPICHTLLLGAIFRKNPALGLVTASAHALAARDYARGFEADGGSAPAALVAKVRRMLAQVVGVQIVPLAAAGRILRGGQSAKWEKISR